MHAIHALSFELLNHFNGFVDSAQSHLEHYSQLLFDQKEIQSLILDYSLLQYIFLFIVCLDVDNKRQKRPLTQSPTDASSSLKAVSLMWILKTLLCFLLSLALCLAIQKGWVAILTFLYPELPLTLEIEALYTFAMPKLLSFFVAHLIARAVFALLHDNLELGNKRTATGFMDRIMFFGHCFLFYLARRLVRNLWRVEDRPIYCFAYTLLILSLYMFLRRNRLSLILILTSVFVLLLSMHDTLLAQLGFDVKNHAWNSLWLGLSVDFHYSATFHVMFMFFSAAAHEPLYTAIGDLMLFPLMELGQLTASANRLYPL